ANDPARPWFVLPGDGSPVGTLQGSPVDAEWGDGVAACAATNAASTAACWLTNAQLPHDQDAAIGYYFTANADPTATGVSDDNDPLAHPPYMSFDWDDSSGFRATRIKTMLDAAIADHGNVTLADMMAIQSDHASRPGKAFAPFIAALPTPAGSPPELAI